MRPMRPMRLIPPLALVLALLFARISPASAATRESVEALFSAMGWAKAWDASVDAQFDALQRLAADRASGPARSQRQVRGDAAMARIRQLLHEDMSWRALGPEIVRTYADAVSQEDIDAQLAFYRGPIGHALLAKAPGAASAAARGGPDALDPGVFTQQEIDGIQAARDSPAARSMKSSQVVEHMQQVMAPRMARLRQQTRQILIDLDAANAAEAASAPTH